MIPLKENEIIKNLVNLGFRKNCVMETITVTENPDGSFNPAPMGVTWIGGTLMEFKPYKATQTYRNLQCSTTSHINLVNDPLLFLYSAFKNEVKAVIDMDGPILLGSEACIAIEKIKESELSEDRYYYMNRVKNIKIYHCYPRVFSRGISEAIEAVIHATRVKAYRNQGKETEAARLEDRIKDCIRLIKKVSGEDSPEMMVSEKIRELLDKWRMET